MYRYELRPFISAGIYTNTYDASLNAKNGFPVFSTQVEANWLSKSQDRYSAFRLTDEDKDEINKLSKDPNIGQQLPFLPVFGAVCTLCVSLCDILVLQASQQMHCALCMALSCPYSNPSGC